MTAETPFASPPPKVTLVNAFDRPYDNAVAAARTCYSSRVVSADDVARDEKARALRDRIARETYAAGHHTTLQHATFQFTLENVSRQLVWSLLHAHPFYNSEQVSQRYVEVAPGNLLVPRLPERQEALYRSAAERMVSCYQRLTAELAAPARDEYFRIFPARKREAERWVGAVKKRCQEVARYILPIATFTHLYHTVSGLTLHRYHRLCEQYDVPREASLVVEEMIAQVDARDPLFFHAVEDPIPLEETLEHALLVEGGVVAGGATARAFAAEFDASLAGRRAKLVDYSVHAESTLAQAVRSVLGLPRAALSDDEAILRVLSPKLNPYLSEALTLSTVAKVPRALSHPHYTFRKKLSHTADSQDQRHRMVPASRPVLHAQYGGAGGEPDVVVPELIARVPAAKALFLEEAARAYQDIDRLLDAGVSPELALYLLPNAFPVRFEESGDLLHLHHKWTTRLCFTAQEEIWRASVDEVEEVRAVHPRIGAHLMPPCQLRDLAGARPLCPEGPRFCGVPVWRLAVDELQRVL